MGFSLGRSLRRATRSVGRAVGSVRDTAMGLTGGVLGMTGLGGLMGLAQGGGGGGSRINYRPPAIQRAPRGNFGAFNALAYGNPWNTGGNSWQFRGGGRSPKRSVGTGTGGRMWAGGSPEFNFRGPTINESGAITRGGGRVVPHAGMSPGLMNTLGRGYDAKKGYARAPRYVSHDSPHFTGRRSQVRGRLPRGRTRGGGRGGGML